MSKPKQAETIFYSEGKPRHSFLSMLRNSEMFSPNIVLIAMRTTEVGVETFSLILNIMSCHRRSNGYGAMDPACLKRRERTEKEQMSTPLPAMALKIPPRNPTNRSTTACHQPKFTMESNVFLLCSLQIETNGSCQKMSQKVFNKLKSPVQKEKSKGKAEPDAHKS